MNQHTPSSATTTTTVSLSPGISARRVEGTGPKEALSGTFLLEEVAERTRKFQLRNTTTTNQLLTKTKHNLQDPLIFIITKIFNIPSWMCSFPTSIIYLGLMLGYWETLVSWRVSIAWEC